MPNWCVCDLRISGKREDLLLFKEWAQGIDHLGGFVVLNEEPFIPYPEEFKERDRIAREHNEKLRRGEIQSEFMQDGFNSGGYEWCVENWGTKWGVCDSTLDESDLQWGSLIYHFKCAWSPCSPIVKEMGRQFPCLKFDLRYFEGGMAFNGILRIENGKVTADERGKYYGERGG